ncbi:MAG: GTP-binding protein [Lachnospiraceae bacterium]|jgi:G3E family GTPase|nr:GTP-binding protein [Lachnospiraceae bacterium]MCH4027657.1 GTP-binding protein [Lachnospiraceae bacterium]MCH4065498.1 GTP-binding protein [Lachnospiraceae bacterium]MCH4111537.1 GTP-binding protein [Lachnospiraceae bacterium]MCI1352908.1 GTP-binding protein [Lachnospiraceae bacterium]
MAKTKIDIVSGFLGAGKTTLIKKLLKEALAGTQVVLIENEFGEIGIDGGFLKESGIKIREMNAGCICCSLVGDFGKSLKEVMEQYHPDRILIEPSGVGKLSDVCRAVNNAAVGTDMEMNSAVAVVDATKAKMYIRNFGEFFLNQIENAGTILLTRTDKASKEQIDEAVKLLREHNSKATIITTPLAELDGKVVLDTIEGNNDLQKEMLEEVLAEKEEEGHHHHHHHHHDEDHDDHDEDEDEDEDDDEDDHDGHEHHHHHHHHEGSGETADENGVKHHHSEHDADEVFGSWGMETPAKFTKERIEKCLEALGDSDKYGVVLRAKGMVPAEDGTWIHFDYVPEETNVRSGSADVTGKICVIGANLNDDSLDALFENRQ